MAGCKDQFPNYLSLACSRYIERIDWSDANGHEVRETRWPEIGEISSVTYGTLILLNVGNMTRRIIPIDISLSVLNYYNFIRATQFNSMGVGLHEIDGKTLWDMSTYGQTI